MHFVLTWYRVCGVQASGQMSDAFLRVVGCDFPRKASDVNLSFSSDFFCIHCIFLQDELSVFQAFGSMEKCL